MGEVLLIEGTCTQIVVMKIHEERLQKIGTQDLLQEGFFTVDAFKVLWNSLHPQATWESDPMVWVVDFRHAGELEPSTCDS